MGNTCCDYCYKTTIIPPLDLSELREIRHQVWQRLYDGKLSPDGRVTYQTLLYKIDTCLSRHHSSRAYTPEQRRAMIERIKADFRMLEEAVEIYGEDSNMIVFSGGEQTS